MRITPKYVDIRNFTHGAEKFKAAQRGFLFLCLLRVLCVNLCFCYSRERCPRRNTKSD